MNGCVLASFWTKTGELSVASWQYQHIEVLTIWIYKIDEGTRITIGATIVDSEMQAYKNITK